MRITRPEFWANAGAEQIATRRASERLRPSQRHAPVDLARAPVTTRAGNSVLSVELDIVFLLCLLSISASSTTKPGRCGQLIILESPCQEKSSNLFMLFRSVINLVEDNP